MSAEIFHYETAFDRNLGWLSEGEQARLRGSCVAIAGVGGAGGYQAQALARLGVNRFKLADPDHFEMTNINRQLGATMSTLGQAKVEILAGMIRDINPEAQVDVFPEGVQPGNLDSFLQDVHLAIDGIDFFEPRAKLLLFDACRIKNIPALTCCPIGFGATIMVFVPEGMSCRDYFDLHEGMTDHEIKAAFAFGLSPDPLALRYMKTMAVDFKKRRASSVVAGLVLVGALTAAEAVKILTGKWPLRPAPNILQLDLLTQQMKRKYYPFGMKSPWQRLKKAFMLRLLNLDKAQ